MIRRGRLSDFGSAAPLLLAGLMLSAMGVQTALGVSLITRQEALAKAYPNARIRAERIFLTRQERERAAALSGVEIPSSLVARYEAHREEALLGRAYVDTHVVRTKKESLLICLNANGSVRRIEVTAFLEPPDYQASRAWYQQYYDRLLDDEMHLNRGIRPVAGATLTAVAANQAVRRVMAIDQVLGERN